MSHAVGTFEGIDHIDAWKKQGNPMKDTIEMLEAIGRDASLRHASTEQLGKVLEASEASAALATAVASGDSSRLSAEFGHREMHMPQVSQVPGHEEEEEGDSEPAENDSEVGSPL